MEKNLIGTIVTTLVISTSSFAQKPTLGVNEYIELLKKNDPQFELIINERLKKEYLVDQGLPSREFLLSASTEYGFALDDSENTNQTTVELSRTLIESGTEITVSRSQNKLSDREETVSSVEIEQKIINDGFGSNTRAKKKVLQNEVQILDLQIKESYEDYIEQRLSAYFELGQLYTELKSSKEIFEEAKKLYQEVLNKRKKSIASTTDVKRAKLQMLVREDEYLEGQTAYTKTVQSLSTYIGKSLLKDIPEFKFDFSKRLTEAPLREEELKEYRSYQIKDMTTKNAKESLDIEKNNGGLSASIVAGASLDDSKRFSTTVKNEEMLIGLRVDIPFGDSNQKALNQKANYEYIKARIEKKNYINELLSNLSQLQIELNNKKRKLEIAKEKSILSESIVKEDTKRYENGRLSLEELITTRNNRATYKKAYISEQMAYNKLVVTFLSATDRLID
ncbi:TolC family protein [Halobacteriovorax sp. GB3]|uniref:TolC family protein n=1 Tax=Halobacteriovorax sp. GB3 TaxID=2719615 RepID=UPI00235E6385|nr:TolC family protein [Halobacteriovorax sp. GB3]MDD0852147.1 TolC family protein [Halobacteriovorax sp. GB3]